MPNAHDSHHPSPPTSHPSPHNSASKHSPITDLAPLEFLQSQRRGSITDPSLHAVSSNSMPKLNTSYRPQQDSLIAPAGSMLIHEHTSKVLSTDPRPTSPYIYTEPPPHCMEPSAHIRKLLHSPTHEAPSTRHPSPLSEELRRPSGRTSSASESATSPERNDEGHKMVVDGDTQDGFPLRRSRDVPAFDYTMRRHSIAAGQDPYLSTSPHGLKRKMSVDRGVFPPVGEEIDPQLIGPGVSAMDLDLDGPAPKRRGSAIDTQRIAQLSLNDRRNSTDFRGPPPWILNGRRDSAASLFPNAATGSGFNSAFTGGESPHARPPPGIATFAWPPNSRPPDHPTALTMQTEGDLSTNVHNSSRNFDANHPNSIMIPPLNYPPDRRLSVPDALNNPSPSRVLRSRSRPPSRQPQGQEPTAPPSATPPGQDETPPPPGQSVSTAPGSAKKEGATPYSRSPELRVSHKLAERKRRKEMKDLFDELRDQLPADRGMKASKWEILSKAIDFITQLKQSHQDMAREIDILRHELDGYRQGALAPPFPGGPSHPVVYGQGPVPYAPGSLPPPHPPSQTVPSRPNSSQNGFPAGATALAPPTQNGTLNRAEPPPS